MQEYKSEQRVASRISVSWYVVHNGDASSMSSRRHTMRRSRLLHLSSTCKTLFTCTSTDCPYHIGRVNRLNRLLGAGWTVAETARRMQALSVNSKDLFFPVCYTTDQDNRQLRDLANLIHSTRRLAHPCSDTIFNHHATMAPAKWASQTEQLVSRCRQLLISLTCEMWITWTSTDWPFHIGRVNT